MSNIFGKLKNLVTKFYSQYGKLEAIIYTGTLKDSNGKLYDYKVSLNEDRNIAEKCQNDWYSYAMALRELIVNNMEICEQQQSLDNAGLANYLVDISNPNWIENEGEILYFWLEADEDIQAACIITYPSSFDVNRKVFNIEYLNGAPWNIEHNLDNPVYKKVHTLLLAHIAKYAVEVLKLDYGFTANYSIGIKDYLVGLGMTSNTNANNINYLSMTEKQDEEFIEVLNGYYRNKN
ncbi:hypothetical protein [Methylomonas sp. ZR1]|uniref:hypothetical protein n=1 Tax=Methylomonas sp. ZR1 TaxID=1797072 RepID=UPI0014930F11|nr:hypothetical protein [Methylomonas sp. ZR1]NOV29254.1 hypothetical protein [Methylomonas sp. ZR1]